MNLKQYIRHLLYDNTTYESPDIYQRFRIVCPEYSQHDIEVKPYPLPESEHMFGLIWDIHEPHTVSATIIPSGTAFTYEKRFEPGMRTQMHSHEYLELFYIVDGEYRQKILGNEFTFHKGELCLIDRNCEHQEILDSGSSTILYHETSEHFRKNCFFFKYGIIRAEKSAAVSAFPSTAGGSGKNGTGALSAAVRVKTA